MICKPEDSATAQLALKLYEIDGLDPFEQADGGLTLRYSGREFLNWQTRIQEARKLRLAQTLEIRP